MNGHPEHAILHGVKDALGTQLTANGVVPEQARRRPRRGGPRSPRPRAHTGPCRGGCSRVCGDSVRVPRDVCARGRATVERRPGESGRRSQVRRQTARLCAAGVRLLLAGGRRRCRDSAHRRHRLGAARTGLRRPAPATSDRPLIHACPRCGGAPGRAARRQRCYPSRVRRREEGEHGLQRGVPGGLFARHQDAGRHRRTRQRHAARHRRVCSTRQGEEAQLCGN
jgi:hypothetical protein